MKNLDLEKDVIFIRDEATDGVWAFTDKGVLEATKYHFYITLKKHEPEQYAHLVKSYLTDDRPRSDVFEFMRLLYRQHRYMHIILDANQDSELI